LESHSQEQLFQSAAGSVRKRVSSVRFAHWLRAGHSVVGVVALAAVLFARRSLIWREGEIWLVLGLVALWILIGFVFSIVRRPNTFDSLLLLDRIGGWKDRFSSAWAFLSGCGDDDGKKLHITKASALITEATFRFRKDLPLPSLRFVWIVPCLAILFALSPLGRIPVDQRDLELSDEMKDTAALQSDELERQAKQIKNLDSLVKDEREELEQLRVEVQEMVDRLADPDDLTAGEMLEALEERARAAERLAKKLGVGEDVWLSKEMLAEMARHPDTANLALAIKDKAAEAAAEESMVLRGVLDNEDITRDTQERMTSALESTANKSTDEDQTRPAGERIGNASRKMLDAQPRTAAREFEELAKHFRFVGEREKAQEKLEDLASSLRDAGGEISGSELQQMEKIAEENRDARAAPSGLQALDANMPEDLQKLLTPQMMSSGQDGSSPSLSQQEGAKGKQPNNAPVPGAGNSDQEVGKAQPEGLEAPVPGENPEPGGDGAGMSLSDKAQDGKGSGGLLAAPVPGEEPGESSNGGGVAMSEGGSSNQAGRGGNQAGTGTAEMFDNETDALKVAKDSEVGAQINDDGESTVRAVEGEARRENATRSRQEIVTEFLSAEEQALDGKSIPRSRRQHVIRYFSAIRRQFEQAENSD
jgi:hypothetical protein